MVKNEITERESKLSFNFEKVFVLKMLSHYYQTGKLAPLSSFQSPAPTDTEYIAAVIGFCQELSRYTLNRACSMDFPSVKLSKEMIIEIYQILLEFDFRNGPLRRKFDGVKYALKTIENIFYELNLQNNIKEGNLPPPPSSSFSFGGEDADAPIQTNQPAAKKARVEKNNNANNNNSAETNTTDSVAVATQPAAKKFHFLSEEEFRGVIQRMAEYDQAREFIIKESRDIQKAAKQAIYAVIRNQLEDARNKLNFCQKKAEKLIADVVTKVSPSSLSSHVFLDEYLSRIVSDPSTGIILKFSGRIQRGGIVVSLGQVQSIDHEIRPAHPHHP
jgi:predicted translin family RNA/ssDNA-binding protein